MISHNYNILFHVVDKVAFNKPDVYAFRFFDYLTKIVK